MHIKVYISFLNIINMWLILCEFKLKLYILNVIKIKDYKLLSS